MRRIVIDKQDTNKDDYLTDASLLQGKADEIIFCHSVEDVKQIVNTCYKKGTPMTIQGGMTGICGGGVPNGGCVINMSEMNDVLGMALYEKNQQFSLKVEPGLLLIDLNKMLLSKKMDTTKWSTEDVETYEVFKNDKTKFFPPDPTESLASIGGMVACDASGACSFKYGSTRRFIESIKVVTLVGGIAKEVHIQRGRYKYADINELFHNKIVPLPDWHHHKNQLKDVAGLYYEEDMDLIDLFIGGEGLFGVITEVELKLINAPGVKMGVMLFLNKDHKIVEFINWLRRESEAEDIVENNATQGNTIIVKPRAIEYFDQKTFEVLNSFRELKVEISSLPQISKNYEGGLYLEFHLFRDAIENEAQIDGIMAQLFDKLNEFGINEAEQWLALEPSDYEKLKNFRHAVPECVNILVAKQKLKESEIKKVGTDMAVSDLYLRDVIDMYHRDIGNMNWETIIFGHIGDNHLHVNMIPKDLESYNASLDMVKVWAEQVISWGGTISAEHGIGKLKKGLLKQMMTESDLKAMNTIKKIIEPSGLINQGVLLE